jgi:hypothetical protein
MLASIISIPDSPLEPLLSDSEAWKISPEQRSELKKIALDFRSNAIKLLSQRQLLLTDAHREISESSPSEKSAEFLKLLQTIATDLQLARLHSLDLAKEILSADQWSWLCSRIDLFPPTDADLAWSNNTAIDSKISSALDARLKDTKVVEIETSHAIAERVISWSKSFAFLVGVPIAALGIVLAILGVKSYTDFRQHVIVAQKEAVQHLDEAKRSAADIDSQARKLRSEYEGLQAQLTGMSNLTQNVRELSTKVQKLEQQLSFINPANLPAEARERALQDVRNYQRNLAQAGYTAAREQLQVFIDPAADNAYFDKNTLVASARGLRAPELIYYSYTLHALNTVHSTSGPYINAVKSGLSDFFSCSYQDNPKLGEQYARVMSDAMPELAKRGFLRNLSNNLRINELVDQPETVAGEAWGGAFWEIRSLLGKTRTERLLWSTWENARTIKLDQDYWTRFAEAVAKEAAKASTADRNKIVGIFERRGLSIHP